MIVTCPKCDKKLRINVESGHGKRIRCPKCSTTFVPSGDQQVEPRPKNTARMAKEDDEVEDIEERPSIKSKARRGPEEDEDDEDREDRPTRRTRPVKARARDEDDDEEYEERPRRKRKKTKGSPVVLWSVLGGSVVALVVGIAVFVLLFSRKSSFSQHEAAVREVIGLMKELGTALESVKDQNSARAAAITINQLCDRLEALGKRERALPRLTVDENRRLQNTLSAELSAMTQRLSRAGFQAGVNSQGEPSFVAAARRLQSMKK